MSVALKCISPVDGTLYAVREALSLAAARQAVAKAHAGQAHWAARPLAERINLVQAAVDIIGQQNDDSVPELAWQMGRPVRYGGEFGGFKERASYMADIALSSLAPIAIEDSNKFQRYIMCFSRNLL